ncbi:MAG: glycosyltransferase [Gammaproteobacteria bacterium]|nr:MAG: glycosyltransferase [Gammaproteobacteria bacterium]TND04513.1 MAG: glycosyltransferase [Gammaproteobacteria bacterium]
MNGSQLNIVLYVNSFLPALGGREFVIHYLADALLTLGHKVRVVGPAGFWKHRQLRFNYPVHRWPTLRGMFPEQVAMAHLALDAALWSCDVVHAHNTYPTGYTAARLKRTRSIPLVITPHGEDIQTIPEIGYGLMLDPGLRQKIVLALKTAERITAISTKIRDVLIEAGAAADKIRLVPNGVDLKRFGQAATLNVREWLGVEPDARLIVTIGRYNPRKGQEYLVRAMPRILAQDQHARLVIVGEKTEVLRPLIKEAGMEGKVILTGGINPSQNILNRVTKTSLQQAEPDYLAELLCSSELYVSAGTDDNSEGLSLAVLEAMGAGIPVVATNISGNKDVVSDGKNGYLVAPSNEAELADAVLKVFARRDVRSDMATAARIVASQYDWVNVARQYVDVYRDAIECLRRK